MKIFKASLAIALITTAAQLQGMEQTVVQGIPARMEHISPYLMPFITDNTIPNEPFPHPVTLLQIPSSVEKAAHAPQAFKQYLKAYSTHHKLTPQQDHSMLQEIEKCLLPSYLALWEYQREKAFLNAVLDSRTEYIRSAHYQIRENSYEKGSSYYLSHILNRPNP